MHAYSSIVQMMTPIIMDYVFMRVCDGECGEYGWHLGIHCEETAAVDPIHLWTPGGGVRKTTTADEWVEWYCTCIYLKMDKQAYALPENGTFFCLILLLLSLSWLYCKWWILLHCFQCDWIDSESEPKEIWVVSIWCWLSVNRIFYSAE